MALKEEDYNDSFVNLWSLLEVASIDANTKSKIDNVIKYIIPILQNDYLGVVFQDITDNLKENLGEGSYNALLEKIDGDDDDREKVAQLIFLNEYEELLERCFDEWSEYPNVRNKIYKLYILKDNKKKLWDLGKNYAKRVEWHLYRLYRTRNSIVHAGDSHERIQILCEHLHVYDDGVIYELLFKLAMIKEIQTVRDVFVDTMLLLDSKGAYFSRQEPIAKSDIKQLLKSTFIEAEE